MAAELLILYQIPEPWLAFKKKVLTYHKTGQPVGYVILEIPFPISRHSTVDVVFRLISRRRRLRRIKHGGVLVEFILHIYMSPLNRRRQVIRVAKIKRPITGESITIQMLHFPP
jgi:hypothetical protein